MSNAVSRRKCEFFEVPKNNGFVAQMSSRKSDPKPQTELCHSHRHRGAQLGKPIQQSGPYL